LLAPVAVEIALAVAFDVQPRDAPTAFYGLLPNASVHGPSTPLDVAWKTNADGE
jgi:hypothetical protein